MVVLGNGLSNTRFPSSTVVPFGLGGGGSPYKSRMLGKRP